ncbi:TetR/AcrR family transcriptional regulator [Microbacterium sp. RD1]|uniref:TetR/AcrR family transcriptional regulator n=1 Tax=Microbacterium sp. RD1 TaxID=3457313 RepID=UPI003FA529D0
MVGTTLAGRETAESIRREAASLFAQHGYEATSLREIASAVGIKVGSLYNHIDSKEDLLLTVMGGTMDDLADLVDDALEAPVDPVERLIAFMAVHVRFHAERAQEVFIGNSELRSLPPDARATITEKRKAYRELIERLIEAARMDSSEEPLNVRLHAFSVVAIGTHVAGWYREGGGLDLGTIVNTYAKIVLRSLGIPEADRRVDELLPVEG